MLYFAQIDANIVTGILQATVAPTVLPAGRTFFDITALPDKNIIGWTFDGLTFHPPTDPAVLASDSARIIAKIGA